MNRKFLCFLLVFISLLTLYLGSSCAPSECVRHSDCPTDKVCFENRCFYDCSENNWCPGAQHCIDGVCMDTECYKGQCEVSDDDADTSSTDDAETPSTADQDAPVDEEKDEDVSVTDEDADVSDEDAADADVSDADMDEDDADLDDDEDFDDDSYPDDDADDEDIDDSDADADTDTDGNGGVISDEDKPFNFSGTYDYNGSVTEVAPELSSIESVGASRVHYVVIDKQSDDTYTYDGFNSDGSFYYHAEGIDLDSFFEGGSNAYVINYSISFNESPSCSVLVNVRQEGTGKDFPSGGSTYTRFTGSETHCYRYSGTGCSVSGCGGECDPFLSSSCTVKIDFSMEERP